MKQLVAPSFPLYVTLPICGIMLAVLLAHARRRDRALNFLLLSLWARYTLSNLHAYTFQPLVGGLTIMAFSTFAMLLAGFLVLGPRPLLEPRLLPFHAMIWLSAVSAVVNADLTGAVNVTLKWLFLMMMAQAAYRATRAGGPAALLRPLVLVFAAPLVLQWLSFATGLWAPNDEGVVSYIGGYEHQQSFAIVILTFLFVVCASSVRLSVWTTVVLLLVAAAGCVLANYRTAILAAVPSFVVCLITAAMRGVSPRRRLAAVGTMAVCLAAAATVIAFQMQDRFADIGNVAAKGTELVKPPDYFTFKEQRLFSGRPYLWSQYIEGYGQGMVINHLLGYGPESWSRRFDLYAHNTFVSTLYELGILGVVALSGLLLTFFAAAARARGPERAILLAFHVTFLLLNLGTMPFWTLEGEILYALVLSQTWWHAGTGHAAARHPLGGHAGTRPRLVSAAWRPLPEGRYKREEGI